MPTSKSKPDLHYACKGGCGRTLTYVRKQRGGRRRVWCPDCYTDKRNAEKRKGGHRYDGGGGKCR